jgi:hypothetical protein
MATPPSFTAGSVLTAAQMNSVGLWLVKSQTIGSGVSSVSVTGAFSADYDAYRIVVNGVDCTSPDTVVLMTLGSTTSGYYGNLGYYKIGTGNGDLPISNGAHWYVGITDGETNTCFSYDLFSPNQATRTAYYGGGWGYLSTFTTAGMLANTTQYTAFTLTAAAGTMTGGTISVYGYRK